MSFNTLEVYADIWCPFAHVGLRAARLVRDKRATRPVPMLIRAWPLELVNGVAMDRARAAEHVRELREQVAPELFMGFDEANFPSTSLPALSLAARAYEVDAPTGEAVSFALRDALFEQGQDIADRSVLEDLGGRFGVGLGTEIDLTGVHEDWRSGQARGVKGSPHFFCANTDAFCPALDIERDALGHLSMRRASNELEAFLEGCFDA